MSFSSSVGVVRVAVVVGIIVLSPCVLVFIIIIDLSERAVAMTLS